MTAPPRPPLAAALWIALLFPGCGPEAEPLPPAPAPAEGALGQGVLETVDPQDPERPLFHDFGELDYGTEVQWSCRMRNTGAEPLRVLSITPACGCTRVVSMTVMDEAGESLQRVQAFDAPELCSVPPGAALELRIDLLTKHSKPNQHKLALVRLRTDSEVSPFQTFELHFLPTKPFIVAPDSLVMQRVPVSHGAEAKCRVQVVKPGLPGQVHRIVSAPEGIEARLEARPFAGETVWTVFATVPPLSPMGVLRGDIVLAVSDEHGQGDDRRVTIPVLAYVGPDAFLDPGMFTFGAVPQGEERLLRAELIGLVPGAKLRVTDARVENPGAEALTVSCAAVDPDAEGRSQRWTVDLRLGGDHPAGYVQGEVVLTLDEPLGGGQGDLGDELRARISGLVR